MHGDAEVCEMAQSTQLKQQTRTVNQIVAGRQGAANSWVIRVDFGMSSACPVWGVIAEMQVVGFCRLKASVWR
jgi:hypothetical protein